MATISNEIRNSKSKLGSDPQWFFSRWVEEYAFANDMKVEEALKLSLFREEGIEYKPALKGEQNV